MSIKNDRWIKRMAEHHGMIEPFSPTQIRQNESGRIISYGTSSYGYDIRCADEFKIFTNVNSVVIDPKNFDDKCFVDFKGSECIIPPNSFALARTVEYFRIPRDVLTVCLGKSTYARCFTGDTKIRLFNGRNITFLKMIEEQANGMKHRGLAFAKNGFDCHVVDYQYPRKIGTEKVIEVHVKVDNHTYVEKCTPDHEFLINRFLNIGLDKYTIQAKDLTSGVKLQSVLGYGEVVKVSDNNEIQDVYCLTVPEYENFQLASSIFVKNCGIVVNVTPFEPEWEGYVTLEFSNTTPLPAKIYANEGCAQVLFFQSDETCEVSYKDRGGKYQHQTGVVVPRM